MMATHVHKPWDTMSPPCFLDARGFVGVDPRDLISVRNGLLHIRTRKLYEATPKFFTRTAIPVTYDPKAKVPRKWLRFLWQVTKRRRPLVDLLQEAIGYTLSSDTHHQIWLFT
jgi:phage/plasmid-associated DNA primase